jgi:hypothetical protein
MTNTTEFGPVDRTGCVSSVNQSNPPGVQLAPINSQVSVNQSNPPFAPINRDGCVSSVDQPTTPQAEVEDVFRGHTIDPEVAAIPRVPDDSQQPITTPEPTGPQRRTVRGFQPEIQSIPEPAEPTVVPQEPITIPEPTVLPQEPMATPEPTVFQPEIISNPESAVPKEPTSPRRTEPTGPRCNILTDPNIQSGPQPRVTGSSRRFKTARRSYF